MDKLTELIQKILEDDENRFSAECCNALHAATEGHPWCEGKTFDQRLLEVRCILAGRRINDPYHRLKLERM